jgi:hypothetical protein
MLRELFDCFLDWADERDDRLDWFIAMVGVGMFIVAGAGLVIEAMMKGAR